jgi:hypothetical protein
MRAVRRGARIRLAPSATIRYRPRERFRGLAAQYFQYGLWKAAVGVRYRLFPPRSALPALAACALAAGGALAGAGRSKAPLIAIAGGYAVAGSVVASSRGSSRVLTSVALATVHASYGIGVLLGAAMPRLVSSSAGRARVR